MDPFDEETMNCVEEIGVDLSPLSGAVFLTMTSGVNGV
jgi:hypothetical protein